MSADHEADTLQLDQPFGLALACRELYVCVGCSGACIKVGQFADELVRLVDPGLGFRSARLGASPQPFNLAVYTVFQCLLVLGLRVQKSFFLFQQLAVVPDYA